MIDLDCKDILLISGAFILGIILLPITIPAEIIRYFIKKEK